MGTALEALGDTQGAESAYRRGEELLDEQSMSVPLSDGRASFLGGRDSSAQLLVDLLTRRGDGPGALATVRTARVRALRAAQRLDRVAALPADVRRRWEEGLSKYAREREAIEAESSADWSVPADRLASARDARRVREDAARAALDEAFRALAESAPPVVAHRSPVEGELLIAFQPSADGRRIHAFTQDSSQVAETTLEPIPSDATEAELADRILTPLAPRISAAKKLLVLSHGPLAGVDVHALPWRGAPLLAHMSVEYPADLPGATESPAGGSRERPRALVVSDTRDDLPQARGEAAAVSVALAPRWDARRLEGKDATRAAVLSQLETADLFHFASHASFDGSRGWDSALHLAHGTVLRTGDILALPRAPRIVVLSACESGRTAAGRVVDMSLAHAFIAAGSHVVIAAMRPVEDSTRRSAGRTHLPGGCGSSLGCGRELQGGAGGRGACDARHGLASIPGHHALMAQGTPTKEGEHAELLVCRVGGLAVVVGIIGCAPAEEAPAIDSEPRVETRSEALGGATLACPNLRWIGSKTPPGACPAAGSGVGGHPSVRQGSPAVLKKYCLYEWQPAGDPVPGAHWRRCEPGPRLLRDGERTRTRPTSKPSSILSSPTRTGLSWSRLRHRVSPLRRAHRRSTSRSSIRGPSPQTQDVRAMASPWRVWPRRWLVEVCRLPSARSPPRRSWRWTDSARTISVI